jgi:ankyrin repeat protein
VKDGRDPSELDALLQKGANVNETDAEGLPLLSYAMSFSPPEAIDKLLKAGANPNALDKFGRSALMHCFAYRRRGASDQTQVVKALLSHGANPKLSDASGRTMAAYAKDAAAALSAPELLALVQ